MATFRGIVCNNDTDYRNKEQLIHNFLYGKYGKQSTDEDGNVLESGDYTSQNFAGAGGRVDLRTTEGKPILVEPSKSEWASEMPTLPLNFQDLDTSIIDRGEL